MDRKISLIIIAHNEEAHIEKCIESILGQSIHPDEVILILHNSTDLTGTIARAYKDIQVIQHDTVETGPQYARMRGFSEAKNEIVACIDGDSIASEGWLQKITQPLIDNPDIVGVGGRIWFLESWGANLASFIFFIIGYFPINRFLLFYFWGANFSCRKSVYLQIGGFERLDQIRKELKLYYPAEDCLLSFALLHYGKIIFASDAVVHVYLGNFFDSEDRGKKQRSDYKKIKDYFFRK